MNLMPHQNEPFNGDTYICEQFIELRDKYKLTTAIETGSCLFGTTKWLSENFKQVHTVEINPNFQREGLKTVVGIKNINAVLGDSSAFLPTVLCNKSIVFLDAHWRNVCPLLDELKAIAKSGFKPIIAIHDFKVPNSDFGFDRINGQAFTWEWIEPIVKQIGNPKISYNQIATGAGRGIIYIEWN